MRDVDLAVTIASLHALSWQTVYRGILTDGYLNRIVKAERLRYWQQRLSALRAMNGRGEIFLAHIRKQPVGFLCIEIGTERQWGAYIDNLHVLPQYQGQGIGARLLKRGAEWAQAHGAMQMYLWVLEKNSGARHFYAREGWVAAEQQVHAMPDGREHTVIRLICPLDPA